MKSKIFLRLCSALVLTLLNSRSCWAQAEIDPDHLDSPELASTAERLAAANQMAGTFEGRFVLAREINCAGTTLTPGTYSLVVRPQGSWSVLTFTPNGTAASVQVRVKSPSSAGRPVALLLERTGQQSVLTSIRLQEPGTMLYLQPESSRNSSADVELVPVSYFARR